MAGQIKGITIEFRGDTTSLDKALRKVKSDTKDVDRQLSAVNKSLKFNPKNVELLTQKQGLLREKVSQTQKSLEDLKSLVMNHLPAEADQREAYKVLSGISSLQDDIRKHILLEECALEGNVRESVEDNSLSAREKEVLVCVAKELINKEIADQLNISIHTVITHRKNISRKTGIKTVAGLTVYALLNNLLDIHSVE